MVFDTQVKWQSEEGTACSGINDTGGAVIGLGSRRKGIVTSVLELGIVPMITSR